MPRDNQQLSFEMKIKIWFFFCDVFLENPVKI